MLRNVIYETALVSELSSKKGKIQKRSICVFAKHGKEEKGRFVWQIKLRVKWQCVFFV